MCPWCGCAVQEDHSVAVTKRYKETSSAHPQPANNPPPGTAQWMQSGKRSTGSGERRASGKRQKSGNQQQRKA